MIWRLNEGKELTGKLKAHYILGVYDDGTIGHLTLEELDETILMLDKIAHKCDASILYINKMKFNNAYIADVCIHKLFEGKYIPEFRVGFFGASGFGKTSFISYLTYQEKDDTNGKSRKLIFKHQHEHLTGKTSSIKHDIIGINDNKIINYKTGKFMTWNKIVNESNYIIDLYDTPGCPQYYRTSLYSLLAYKFNLYCIVISPYHIFNNQHIILDSQTETFIKLISQIKKKILFVFSKCDLITHDFFNSFFYEFNKYIKTNFNIKYDLEYVKTSSVYGFGHDDIIKKINSMISICSSPKENDMIEFIINDTLIIPKRGEFFDKTTIVSGTLLKGQIEQGKQYLIGPVNNKFYPITINNIHKKQIDSKYIYKNESGSFQINNENEDIKINKHLVIIDNDMSDNLRNIINVKLKLSPFDYPIIKKGMQLTIYINNTIVTGIVHNINMESKELIIRFTKNKYYYIKKNHYCILQKDSSFIIAGYIL